jgi:hypothetical protein
MNRFCDFYAFYLMKIFEKYKCPKIKNFIDFFYKCQIRPQ